MRDLPVEFDESDNESMVQNSNSGSSGGGVLVLFISVCLATLAAVTVSFLMASTERKTEVLEIVGVKAQAERRVNPLEPLIAELKTAQDQQEKSIADLKQNLAALQSDLDDKQSASSVANDKLAMRLTTLERFTSDLSLKVDDQKKRTVIAQKAAAQKPIETPKPTIPVSLNSVRSINGTYWISLRTASESSPLLTLQDQWRGLRVLEVNYQQGSVVLSNNGVTQILSI